MIKFNKEVEEVEEVFISFSKKGRKVNVWCEKILRNNISDSDFKHITNEVINESFNYTNYKVSKDLVTTKKGDEYILSWCLDEENTLNIDNIKLI